MNFSFPDAMVVQALDFGPGMTARQSIQTAKKIMLDLEMISPWRRPFAVSGCTKETGDMPIAADSFRLRRSGDARAAKLCRCSILQ